MSFSDLIASVDATCLSVFGEITVTIHFKAADDGQPDVTITAISKNPALEEDYIPGGAPGATATNLILFIPAVSSTGITHGDTATVNGVDYDIYRVDIDREGAASMRLKRRTQRWDQ